MAHKISFTIMRTSLNYQECNKEVLPMCGNITGYDSMRTFSLTDPAHPHRKVFKYPLFR